MLWQIQRNLRYGSTAVLAPGNDIRKEEAVTSCVEVAMLPKAIGGDAVTIDKETDEEDDTCTRGAKHMKLSEFLATLEG